MLKHRKQMLLSVLALLTALFVSPLTALADQTWIPTFDPGRTVHVDPNLDSDLAGLEQKLEALAREHGLAVYFVYTLQGSEQAPPGMKFAPWKLDQLVDSWSKHSRFPHENYLVILVVRANFDPTKHSVAANGGNKLQAYGLTADRFSQGSGPVLRDFDQYLPVDPGGYAQAVVRRVNQDIDHYYFMQKLPARIGFGIASLIFLAVLIWLIVRFRRQLAAGEKLIGKWRPQVQNAGQRYGELEEYGWAFLKRQGDWEKRFQGITLTRFREVVAGYAELTLGKLALSKRFDEAEKLFSRAHWYTFPFVGGLRRAQALLESEPITVTGDTLSVEQASLFGSLVREQTFTPDELMTKMEKEFATVRDGLKSIMGSFEGAEQNKKDIAGLQSDMDQLQQKVVACGLTIDPYRGRLSQIGTDQQAFESILYTDPLEAYKQSEVVEDHARRCKDDLLRAIRLMSLLPPLEVAIEEAEKRVCAVRTQTISYSYPLAGDEQPPASSRDTTFSLCEEAGNPDALIAKARRHYQAALQAVLAGQLDACDSERQQGMEATSQAQALVKTVLEAKAFVEQAVPKVRINLSTLRNEISGAAEAVATLKADFIAKNYEGQPDKLARSRNVIFATDAELAKIKAAYDEQRYLAARQTVETLGSDIQSCRDGLVEIHSRLTKLKDLRKHSRETVSRCETHASALKAKLEQHAFTTSAATDQSFAKLLPVLTAQRDRVDKAITDWVAAAEAADRAEADLNGVDAAIDQAHNDHERAVGNATALESAVSEVASAVNHTDVRQPARNKLADARAALTEVNTELKHPKNDWAKIARRAESADKLADEAKSLATRDKQAASSARSSIQGARSAINSADRSYGEGVAADLGNARSLLSQAESAMSRDDYEEADRLADRAKSAASDAESSARSKAARRRREREDAEAAAERARRRRMSTSSPIGGGSSPFSGGGRSGGGNFGGGGRSGGGGHF